MPDISITKDATSLLKAMNSAYKKKRKKGCSKQEAVIFGDSSDIQKEIMSQWSLEDIDDACWELAEAGLLECFSGDDSIQLVILTNAGLNYFEGWSVRATKAALRFLKELLPFIPPIP